MTPWLPVLLFALAHLLDEAPATGSSGEALSELEGAIAAFAVAEARSTPTRLFLAVPGLLIQSGCISEPRARFTFGTEIDAESEGNRAFNAGRVHLALIVLTFGGYSP